MPEKFRSADCPEPVSSKCRVMLKPLLKRSGPTLSPAELLVVMIAPGILAAAPARVAKEEPSGASARAILPVLLPPGVAFPVPVKTEPGLMPHEKEKLITSAR